MIERLKRWLCRSRRQRRNDDDDKEIKEAVRRYRISAYIARRRARRSERVARNLSDLLQMHALSHEGIRAAEAAIEFMHKARRDDKKQ
jgi:predicted ATPase with chaperone activity